VWRPVVFYDKKSDARWFSQHKIYWLKNKSLYYPSNAHNVKKRRVIETY